MSDRAPYGGNFARSCGFKTRPAVSPRQTQIDLAKKQSAVEAGVTIHPFRLDTYCFSVADVKASVSHHHGKSRSSTRGDLLGGRPVHDDNTMYVTNTLDSARLSNPPLTTDLLESRRSSRIYKVGSRVGVRGTREKSNLRIRGFQGFEFNLAGENRQHLFLEGLGDSSRSPRTQNLLEGFRKSSRKVGSEEVLA